MEQFINILMQQLVQHSVTLLGTFLVAIAFGIFYGKNTQYTRFRLISNGFWILSLSALEKILVPCFPLLNPAIQIPETVLEGSYAFLYILAGGCFLSSLFIRPTQKVLSFVLPFFFAILLGMVGYALLILNIKPLPTNHIPDLLVGISLTIAALGFHTIPTTSQKIIFTVPRTGLMAIGIYFILFAFQLIAHKQIIPFILYSLVSIVILIAQIQFMADTASAYQQALETEKKRKTLFWDVAPFPILLTKLIDDSVVYMNPACQRILGLSDEQKTNLRFSSYFAKPDKRVELINLTKQRGVVDNFEVELNVQNAKKTLWITLSSRVFEMDGELVLYINFTNITEQKETEQALFIQASTDTLTGLFNRRQFFALTNQAFALASREKTPYCVIMLDIDHFKNINDTYGHDVGDIVLKSLADVMKATLRQSDIIARWGGEEFIVFLQNTLPQNAITPAQKLRTAVEKTVVTASEKQIQFTISLGISASQVSDINIIQKEADLALYHSKENGRNQVTLYSPELATMPTEVESDR